MTARKVIGSVRDRRKLRTVDTYVGSLHTPTTIPTCSWRLSQRGETVDIVDELQIEAAARCVRCRGDQQARVWMRWRVEYIAASALLHNLAAVHHSHSRSESAHGCKIM